MIVRNFTAQGILAKLLASENITVHIGEYETAFFDVKNRILGLPSWNTDSKDISDLMIAHEVGHALWTPAVDVEEFKKSKIPFSLYNIVEDVRIERKIKDKYPGLSSVFSRGYGEFIVRDFFKIAGTDVNTLGFADRLNLKAKLQHLIDIRFTKKEQEILDRCFAAETFEDVKKIVEDIYDMIKAKPKPKPKATPKPQEPSKEKTSPKKVETPDADDEESNGGESEGDEEESENGSPAESPEDKEPESKSPEESDDGTTSDSKPSDSEEDGEEGSFSPSEEQDAEEAKSETDADDDEELGKTDAPSYGDNDLTSQTQEELSRQLDNMHTVFGNVMPIIPPTKEESRATVIPYKKILADRQIRITYKDFFTNSQEVKEDWVSFKKKTTKHIQYLISNFERRKAAFQYTRARTSDSGDISLNKLQNYKFDDNIFNSVTKLADAKNHGMIFVVDYSGSMGDVIGHVINQTLNLVMFCKAVSIPFRVYGFTSPEAYRHFDGSKHLAQKIVFEQNLKIMELLSSEMNAADYDLGMKQMRAQAYYATHPEFYMRNLSLIGGFESLGSTPLNAAIVAMHDLVDDFKKKYPIQKMNVIFLSDGASHAIQLGHNSKRTPEGIAWKNRLNMNLHGRNITLTKGERYENYNYSILIENLRITKKCTVIGFFLGHNTQEIKLTTINAYRYNRTNGLSEDHRMSWSDGDALRKKGRKEAVKDNVAIIYGGFCYDCYFVMSTRDTHISEEEKFEYESEEADFSKVSNQNKISKEFTKFTSAKKTSRVILGKFAELIA